MSASSFFKSWVSIGTVSTLIIILSSAVIVIGTNNDDDVIYLEGKSNATLSLGNYNPHTPATWSFRLLAPYAALATSVESIPADISFLVFQTHAYLHNVTLSYKPTLDLHNHVNGSNVGLVWNRSMGPVQFFIINDNPLNVTVMLTIVAYGSYAPIPGGCNMEFAVETAPYLRVWYTDSLVVVNAQPAKLPNVACAEPAVAHDVYRMYLSERDFSQESYFAAIQSMLTPQDVLANGTLAPVPIQGSHMRRVYSSYPGTGSVYVVVARSLTGESVYVPALTYGCSSIYFTDSCTVLSTTFSKVLCACVFFLGLFTCLFGHSFFKTEIFLSGFLAGGLVGYVIVCQLTTLPSTLGVTLACVIGAVAGILWLFFWYLFAVPVAIIMVLLTILGVVFASLVFFSGLGDQTFAQLDVDYWLTFFCLSATIPLLLLPLSYRASIIACAVVGAYAVVVPVDHYVGGSLKYIVLNALRRSTVDGFSQAIIDPPFQLRDGLLTAVWFVLAVIGARLQDRRQEGRAPFPPGPRTLAARRGRPAATGTSSARTPIRVSSHIPYGYGSVGDDDVFETPPGSRQPGKFSRWLRKAFTWRRDYETLS